MKNPVRIRVERNHAIS